MIEVEALTHRYGPLTAVDDLSFSVERGEILGLLGPNGAGKSTAMRAIVGLLNPTRGQIRLAGHDLATHGLQARERLGYLPENVSLYRELTVREFLRFAGKVKGIGPRLGAEVSRVIGCSGLSPVENRLIGHCSRGFRQRIGLAQALIGDPAALVLDEPTVGLDPSQVVDIRRTIQELSRDKAVILSTHILPEASLLCDRVLILDQGKTLAVDRPGSLAAALSGKAILIVRCHSSGADPAPVLASHPGVQSAEFLGEEGELLDFRIELREGNASGEVNAALVGKGCRVEEIHPRRMGLEDVFMKLVRHEGEEQ